MKKESFYRREIFLGEYRVEWADQKISLTCICAQEEVEIFSDTYSTCPACKRRFSILELIIVEAYQEYDSSSDRDIDDTLDYLESNDWKL